MIIWPGSPDTSEKTRAVSPTLFLPYTLYLSTNIREWQLYTWTSSVHLFRIYVISTSVMIMWLKWGTKETRLFLCLVWRKKHQCKSGHYCIKDTVKSTSIMQNYLGKFSNRSLILKESNVQWYEMFSTEFYCTWNSQKNDSQVSCCQFPCNSYYVICSYHVICSSV